jgi:ribosomal protein S18 acetylase RimI-like enzyme
MSFRQRCRCALLPWLHAPPPGGFPGGVFAREPDWPLPAGALAAWLPGGELADGAVGEAVVCATAPVWPAKASKAASAPSRNEEDMKAPGLHEGSIVRDVRVEDFDPADTHALVRMWRESFEHGVGIADPHSVEEHIAYFEREVVPANRVQVAREAGLIVGFIAAGPESVAQLHVRVGHHRRGIGRHLLNLAKAQSGGSLWLYTFARNKTACAFYESQGFEVIQRGFEPTWQLEDVKYAWTKGR